MSVYRRLAGIAGEMPFLGRAMIGAALRRRYDARSVNRAKIDNYMQVLRDIAAREVEVTSLPYRLNLDPGNVCNLRCPFCPTGTKQLDRTQKFLPLAAAKRAIDAVKAHAMTAWVHNWGEPFLHPEIFDIYRHAADADLFVVSSTNFSVDVPDLGRRLVESGLGKLMVSLDGMEQKTLQVYRRGADYQKIIDNVTEVVEARGRLGAKTPLVELCFHVFRHNEHEVPMLEDLRRRLGADSLDVSRSFIYHREFVPANPKFAPLGEMFHGTCDFLYSELTIEADGGVSPCCTNTSRRWNTGTVEDLERLPEFWNSKIMRTMRSQFREDYAPALDEPETLCKHCRLVAPTEPEPDGLSHLPASLRAEGQTFHHGIDRPGGHDHEGEKAVPLTISSR